MDETEKDEIEKLRKQFCVIFIKNFFAADTKGGVAEALRNLTPTSITPEQMSAVDGVLAQNIGKCEKQVDQLLVTHATFLFSGMSSVSGSLPTSYLATTANSAVTTSSSMRIARNLYGAVKDQQRIGNHVSEYISEKIGQLFKTQDAAKNMCATTSKISGEGRHLRDRMIGY